MGFSCEFSGNHWKKALRIPTYELEAMRSNTSHARLLTLHNFQTVNAHSTDLRWCGTCGGITPGWASFPLTWICSKGAEDLFSNCWSPLQSLQSTGKIWSETDPIAMKRAVHLNLAKKWGLFHMYPATGQTGHLSCGPTLTHQYARGRIHKACDLGMRQGIDVYFKVLNHKEQQATTNTGKYVNKWSKKKRTRAGINFRKWKTKTKNKKNVTNSGCMQTTKSSKK
jgi:hypothetical protein